MTFTKKIALDLFAGAGGLSFGAERTGIEVAVAIEYDNNAAKTYKRNHPNTDVIYEDITKISPESLNIERPFIIFGGPPCQGFSLSNTRTRNTANLNNGLFSEFIKFVSYFKPEWFVFENVEGIINFNKGQTILEIKKQFKNLGYEINDSILYASDYGVPQKRNRYILVGNSKGKKFIFPQKSIRQVTVEQALSDLPSLKNGDHYDKLPYKVNKVLNAYQKLMRRNSKFSTQNYVSKNKDYVVERYTYIKPGENWRAIPIHLMSNYTNINNCHSGIYKRLDPSKPSVVISNYRKNMLIHPWDNRGLSVREASRLQSFPDDFIFEGSIHYIQQQIGNAVPPLLAEEIFKQILQIEENK
jgi:DNA (cytosine-5)-methyltransferase 1